MAKELKEHVAVLVERTETIQKDVAEIKHSLATTFVRKSEFDDMKKIVYGTLIGLITAVGTALVKFFVK